MAPKINRGHKPAKRLYKKDLQAIYDKMKPDDKFGYEGDNHEEEFLTKDALGMMLADLNDNDYLEELPQDTYNRENAEIKAQQEAQAAQQAQPAQQQAAAPAGTPQQNEVAGSGSDQSQSESGSDEESEEEPENVQNEGTAFLENLKNMDPKNLDKALKAIKADEIKKVYNSLPDQETKNQFATDFHDLKQSVQMAKDFKGHSPAAKAVLNFTKKYSKYIPALMGALTAGLATGAIPPDFFTGTGAPAAAGGTTATLAGTGATAAAPGGIPPIPASPEMIPFDRAAAGASEGGNWFTEQMNRLPQNVQDIFKTTAKTLGVAAAMKAIWHFLPDGFKEKFKEIAVGKDFENFTPEQQGIIGRLGKLGIEGLEKGGGDFEPIRKNAINSFYNDIVPGIKHKYSGDNWGTSAVGTEIGAAGSDLSSKLAALQSQHETNRQGQFTNLAQLGITPKFPNATIKADNEGGLLGGALRGLESSFPSLVEGYLGKSKVTGK